MVSKRHCFQHIRNKRDDKSDDGKSGSPPTPKGEKKSIPDAKGGNKKRIDSEKGMKQGKPEDTTYDTQDKVIC